MNNKIINYACAICQQNSMKRTQIIKSNAYWLTFSIYVLFEVTMNVWNVYMHNKFPNNEFTLTCQMDHIIFMFYVMLKGGNGKWEWLGV